MKQKTKTVAAAGALEALKRFRALRCGADGFVAMDGAVEALTLTRCRGNGLLWATPIEPRYRALAAALNDAEVPFDRIVSSGEIEPAS
ncbi:MAG: hypothetical protein JNJ88_18180, partial [Planctomycetes bacterium]|nr:hypothetical protein [Planctomycetota bacterium]